MSHGDSLAVLSFSASSNQSNTQLAARLSLHAANPDVMFHGNHVHTMSSHKLSHGNAQECTKTTGFAIM